MQYFQECPPQAYRRLLRYSKYGIFLRELVIGCSMEVQTPRQVATKSSRHDLEVMQFAICTPGLEGYRAADSGVSYD